ncbi:hypothetical protein [Desulfosarcina ovata]|nr:hypothetical protein [Desulfosarcina ovata]
MKKTDLVSIGKIALIVLLFSLTFTVSGYAQTVRFSSSAQLYGILPKSP